MAGNGSAEDIHRIHLSNGWAGIGYHFVVRKNGEVFRGRPIDTVGAHCTNYNSVSIGVCFEGNFETESMSEKQKNAGAELVNYLMEQFPDATVKKHRDFNSTACPGKNFPFGDITAIRRSKFEHVPEIVTELSKRGIVTNPGLWNVKCVSDNNAYWLARKIANMTVNRERATKLETVNDIVWELNYRGIMTDSKLWLTLLEKDKDLYWLAYKACNMTVNKEGA